MRISAFIFDMDDLLVSTAALWRRAEETLLAAIGQKWTPEVADQYKGMNAPDVAAVIHHTYNPAWPLKRSQQMMRTALLANFDGGCEPMPGALRLVRNLRDAISRQPDPRRAIAVASGSPLPAIEQTMHRLGIHDCFDRLISSESVARGKPHPDVFLAAAAALGVQPPGCLVFEDSLIGVRGAARAAGMRVFSVPLIGRAEITPLADRVFDSLADIDDKELLS